MTKTLTEQWREGTLPDGAYYILVDKYEQNEPEIDVGVCYNSTFEWWIVKEVLAPVPGYSEYQALKDNCEFTHTRLKGTHQKITQLEKKLEIATKALDHCQGFDFVQYALKEMEGVK